MIVHIPHDGRWMPDGLSCFDGTMTPLRDFGARQVFEGGHGTCLVFPVDRLVCDVERFLENEPMEVVGMGVCYERNANLGHLRTVDPWLHDELVRRFYEPHHARLKELVDAELAEHGRSLIIDGHTFSAIKRKYELSEARPQIDIGHDGDSPSVGVAGMIIETLSQWYDVSVNEPFAGSLRPMDYIGDERVASVMIEVRQDLDMELARERIQEAIAIAATGFYGETSPSASVRQRNVEAFSDCERHRRLDALAEKYGYVDGFPDLAYAHWDDCGLGSDGLAQIERLAESDLGGIQCDSE